MSRRSRDALFDLCNAEVLRAQADGDTPCFLPYLNGRLEQPEARACFIGLASWHGLPQMIRAVYEGVAFEHRGHIDHLLAGREWPRAARFAGGAARSRPWLEIFASAIDLPLELSSVAELGALGAAIIAGVGVGLYPELEAAVAAMTRVERRVDPDPGLSRILARRRAVFNALREALGSSWGSAQLTEINSGRLLK